MDLRKDFPSLKGKKIKSTERSLKYLRNLGMIAAKCEQWIQAPGRPGGGVRVDLFGFADIIAYDSEFTIAVQCTSVAQVARHLHHYRKDIAVSEIIMRWLASPYRLFMVHGWEAKSVPTKSGSERCRWFLRELCVTSSMFQQVTKGR